MPQDLNEPRRTQKLSGHIESFAFFLSSDGAFQGQAGFQRDRLEQRLRLDLRRLRRRHQSVRQRAEAEAQLAAVANHFKLICQRFGAPPVHCLDRRSDDDDQELRRPFSFERVRCN